MLLSNQKCGLGWSRSMLGDGQQHMLFIGQGISSMCCFPPSTDLSCCPVPYTCCSCIPWPMLFPNFLCSDSDSHCCPSAAWFQTLALVPDWHSLPCCRLWLLQAATALGQSWSSGTQIQDKACFSLCQKRGRKLVLDLSKEEIQECHSHSNQWKKHCWVQTEIMIQYQRILATVTSVWFCNASVIKHLQF